MGAGGAMLARRHQQIMTGFVGRLTIFLEPIWLPRCEKSPGGNRWIHPNGMFFPQPSFASGSRSWSFCLPQGVSHDCQ